MNSFFKTGFLLSVVALSACNYTKQGGALVSSESAPPIVGPMNAAGIGGSLSGTGALSAPTADAVIGRLEGVMGVARRSGSAFAAAINQQSANLSNTTDPTQFSGGDANMLLAYAACTDMTFAMGNWGKINTKATTAANQSNLVNAGLAILDKYTYGLASTGSAKVEVTAALNTIVAQAVHDNDPLKVAFVTVCVAANTAGTTLLGF